MQFRILPVAVALLGMYMVVVLAADPCVKADVQHAKCYGYDHRRHWIAENEEVDAEAMKTKLPADYPEMGWVMYKSGKCTYKRSYRDCPRKEHWHRHEDDWDREYGYKRLGHTCTVDSQCCSGICKQVKADGVAWNKACCTSTSGAFNATCTWDRDCCSWRCGTLDGLTNRCLAPNW